MSDQSAYPLAWPVGWPRTAAPARVFGSFDGTPDKVRREMLAEVDRLAIGAQARTHTVRRSVVVSTNIPLRRDGEPMAARLAQADPGVAVYFQRQGKPFVVACDRYDAVWKNMRAIHRTLEALRGIERWGSSALLERAFQGFAALPAPTRRAENCWTILGVAPGSSLYEIEQAFRGLAKVCHPDGGGTSEDFQRLNQARDEARAAMMGGAR